MYVSNESYSELSQKLWEDTAFNTIWNLTAINSEHVIRQIEREENMDFNAQLQRVIDLELWDEDDEIE
jgi:hypothetical protein